LFLFYDYKDINKKKKRKEISLTIKNYAPLVLQKISKINPIVILFKNKY